MKGGDLVVVQIGGDEGLGGELGVDHPDVLGRHAVARQPLAVGREVAAHGRHGYADIAEELQVVGDVAGAAAEFAAQLRHQERHVQHVDLVGQDVIGEAVAEHHDGVEGHRAADQDAPPQRGRSGS